MSVVIYPYQSICMCIFLLSFSVMVSNWSKWASLDTQIQYYKISKKFLFGGGGEISHVAINMKINISNREREREIGEIPGLFNKRKWNALLAFFITFFVQKSFIKLIKCVFSINDKKKAKLANNKRKCWFNYSFWRMGKRFWFNLRKDFPEIKYEKEIMAAHNIHD